MTKIKTDENGTIVDGHHRAEAAAQLGIRMAPNEFEVAWLGGIRAHKEGKQLQDCPHPLGSALAGEWCMGWELANTIPGA